MTVSTMKAFRLVEWGQPGQYCEVPKPKPKQGEVLVRMKAAGLCRSDLDMVDCKPGEEPYASVLEAGYTLGHENAGFIEELGEGVTGLEIGESVVVHHMPHCTTCEYCIRGIEQHCLTHQRGAIEVTRGTGWDGGLAEFLICPRDELISIGKNDPVMYAPLTDAGVTSYHAVDTMKDRLRPGTTAIVIGIGGLGMYALQFLKIQTDATIYAIDVSEERLKVACELGATKGFLAGPNTVKEIMDETKGRGIDGILDLVGSTKSLGTAMAISKPQGRIVLVGMDMGTVEVGWGKIATSCEFAISLGSTRKDLQEVCHLASQGKLRIEVDPFPFDKIPEAYDALRQGKLKGRAVIVFD